MKRSFPLIRSLCAMLLGWSTLSAVDMRADDLVRHLNSPRPVERLATLTVLAKLNDPSVVPSVLKAMRTHERLGSSEITALAAVLQRQRLSDSVALLSDPHRDLVEAVITDLGQRPPAELEPVIKHLLGGSDDRVVLAQRILELVVRQGGKTPAHAALALLQFQDAKEQRRAQAVQSLARQATLDHGMVAHIRLDMSALVRVALVEVLASHLSASASEQPEQARWLRAQLHELAADAADHVRVAVFDRLQSGWHNRPQNDSPAADLDLFLAAMSDANPRVRAIAVQRFGWSPMPAAIPHIERLAADPEGMVAYSALTAAERLVLPSLANLAFQGCSLPHPQTRRTALRILMECKDTRLIPVATRLLDDPDWEVRRNAQAVLAEGNVGSDTGVLALAQVAKLRPGERQGLLVRLAQLDPPERTAEIGRLYTQMTPAQRLEFMQLCARDPSLATGAGEFLIQRTADPDPQIAVFAFDALRGINSNVRGSKLGVAEAFSRMEDRDQKVAKAARHLLSTGVNGAGVFEWLLARERTERPYQDPDRLPPRPTTPAALVEFIATAKSAALDEQERYFIVLGRIDDPRALAALREASRSSERAIRWAALDALVRRGDQEDATLDHALARLLTTEPDRWTSAVWPVVDARLLTRLPTFTKLADAAALAKLRTEIERRVQAITALEVVR